MWISETPFECPGWLLDKTRDLPASRIAVVNAQSAPVIESIAQAVEENLVEPVLIGDLSSMRDAAKRAGLDISRFRQIDAENPHEAVRRATDLVNEGSADAVMKGHIQTHEFLRGLLNRDTGIRGEGLLTHVFYMTLPGEEKPLLITDAAIHVLPDESAMQSIIRNAVLLAHKSGLARPRIAMLSAAESVNEAVPSSLLANSLADWADANIDSVDACGPLALDLAISKKAAAIKGIDDPVAGAADILVVPNVETGNALFKALVYFKGACAAGLALGCKVPVVLTSRADPPEARLAAIALAALVSG